MRRSMALPDHALQSGEYHALHEALARRIAASYGVALNGADADEAILRILIKVAQLRGLKCDDAPEDRP